MNNFTAGIVSWLLLPVAAWYGLGVRKRTPRLLPPHGPQTGKLGDGAAQIRVLFMGDSSVAGVGVDDISQTLAPQVARSIHARNSETVSWRAAGANSAMAKDLRDYILPNIDQRDFTHIILCIGTNDMKNFLTANRFKKGFGGLLYAIHARWPQAKVIWSPVLNMPDVPALPPILTWILKLRTQIINSMGNRMCRERQAIAATPMSVHSDSGFAIDRFHANAKGYQFWAEHLTRIIMDGKEL